MTWQRTAAQVVAPKPLDSAAAAGQDEPALIGWRRIVLAGSLAAGLVYVLALYGFAPGMSQVPLTPTTAAGQIQCLHAQGIASLWSWCSSLGLPLGAPLLTGLPETYAGWLLSYLPGVDPLAAHQLTSGVLVVAAFFASYLLLRRWQMPRWIALLATLSYLSATNLLQLNGFAYTFLGYILLPAYVYTAVRVLDLMDRGRAVLAALICAGLCLFMVFTEGYSFFGAGVVIGFLVCRWGWHAARARQWRRVVTGFASWLIGAGGAASLYAAWVPEHAYQTAGSPDIFATYSVDVASLFVPTNSLAYPQILHLTVPALHLWGSSAAYGYSYLGYGVLVLAAGFGVAALFRAELRSGELGAVALAGALALVLSFGPALKVFQQEPGAAAAMFQLPTAWIYQSVPGISDMRVVARWLVVTRWSVIVLAAGGLSLLWRRWRGTSPVRSVAVVLVALLAAGEIAPDLAKAWHSRQLSAERIDFLREGIVSEGDRLLRDDETLLMLPSNNDFLANYLVPMVGARSYNVGVDKNYALSVSYWPKAVLAARSGYGPGSADLLCAVLDHDADAIVLPYIDPHNGPLLFGNDPASEKKLRTVARRLAKDPRFEAVDGRWMTVLREADGSCSR